MTSQILNHILSDLGLIDDVNNTPCIRHTVPLRVLLLQKKQGFFITDGYVIIQATMLLSTQTPPQSRNDIVHPLNRIRTNYYNFSPRIAAAFIFNQDDHTHQLSQFPNTYHPYQPQFYFQHPLPTHKPQKQLIQLANNTETLILNQWQTRIVNIANTGYYGAILEIYSYKRKKEILQMQPTLHLVLYEKQLSNILDRLRITDMRKYMEKPNLINPISLCYYRKNIKVTNINKPHYSNFVAIDHQSKILKVNQQYKHHYLPLGNLTGVYRFIRPLPNHPLNKKPTLNFNIYRSHSQPKIPQENESSSQDISQEDPFLKQIIKYQLNSVSSDSISGEEQEEQPLKLVYLKQFDKNVVV